MLCPEIKILKVSVLLVDCKFFLFTKSTEELSGPVMISYGSLMYASLKEELSVRSTPSGTFHSTVQEQTQNDTRIVPVEWDSGENEWVVVLILEAVSVFSSMSDMFD